MKMDFDAILGTAGTALSIALQRVSESAAVVAATATAVYMCLRARREWMKMKRDSERRAEEFVRVSIKENNEQRDKK